MFSAGMTDECVPLPSVPEKLHSLTLASLTPLAAAATSS